jgi:methyl-accepting chemotaxis protein
MQNMTIKIKILAISIISLVLLVVSVLTGALLSSTDSLLNKSFEQLISVRDIKKSQINSFFAERKGDIEVLASSTDVKNMYESLEVLFDKYSNTTDNKLDINNTQVKSFIEANETFLKTYIQKYGYYDLFIIDSKGYIIYTASKESDFGANIINSSLKDSSLAYVYNRVKSTHKTAISDMKPYIPSNNEPAMFIAHPIKGSEAIVALQISDKSIKNIMNSRSGMGKSGETYLVGQDKLMRSDSFLDPTNHSIRASFANPTKGSIDTEAVRNALNSKNGIDIIKDYNNQDVLSAYDYISVGEFKWAIIAEVDKAEIMIAPKELAYEVITIALIIVVATVILLVLFINISINRPLVSAIKSLIDGTEQVKSSSSHLAISATSLSENATSQAASVEEISATIEQMSSSISINNDNIKVATTLSSNTTDTVNNGYQYIVSIMNSMKSIEDSSNSISNIIQTIDEIAFQTNLLALNAAVEAARAGEHGLGFAVVAEEVRALASKSAEAAQETSTIIEKSISEVKNNSKVASEANSAFEDILKSISNVDSQIKSISLTVSEQKESIEQISKAIITIDRDTQSISANSEESAAEAEELSSQAVSTMDIVNNLSKLVGRA